MNRALFACADALHLPMPDRSVDLVFGSPPYCEARTYDDGTLPSGHTVGRDCREWVAWMLAVTTEAMRVSRGPVMWVVAGVTRDRNYWPAPEGLLWEWWQRGGECHCYRPCAFVRTGVPGSGGDDWLRAEWEYVLCFKRPGALPYGKPTANGKPPVYAPGGAPSNRLPDGRRCREMTKRKRKERMEVQTYREPAIANPGNWIRLNVGGGNMGNELAHDNEAPFPEALAAWFVRGWCPPGGVVLDPFSGSGTTVAAARHNGCRGIGFDLRTSQCSLGRERNRQRELDL